jgi:hypothetical protein
MTATSGGVMRYALLTYTDESAVVSNQERSRRARALASFEDQMREQGVLLASEHLHPAGTAATVRGWDGGDVFIADGPFAGTREQICGLLVIECQNLDAAIEAATRVPAAWYGTIEVRPLSAGPEVLRVTRHETGVSDLVVR